MKPSLPGLLAAAATVLGCALVCSSCIDAPLSDAQLDDKIDQQSKPYPTAVMLADCLGRECQQNSNTCYDTCSGGASKEAKELGDPLWSCWKAKCHSNGAGGGTVDDITKCLMLSCAPELRAIIVPKKTGATDCPGTLGCMELCDPTKAGLFTCYQQCFDEATEIGRNALTHWGECASKTSDDPIKACHAEVVACHANIQLDSGKCVTFAACGEACPAGKAGESCTLQCRDKLDEDGKKKFDDLLPCFKQTTSTPKCNAATLACVEPSGKTSCLDTYRCAARCQGAVAKSKSQDGFGCLYSCMHGGTMDAAEQVMKLGNCGANGDIGKCVGALNDCGAAAGDGSCQSIQQCNDKCNADGHSGNAKVLCGLECLHAAKPKAAKAYTDLLGCYVPCEATCGKGAGCKSKCGNQCKAEIQACAAN